MGTVTHTAGPFRGGRQPAVSRGAVRFTEIYTTSLMGATYATSGDTVNKPDAPDGFSLYAVEIISAPALPVGITLHWNGNTTTPKILAYDEDDTSGVAAELGNGSAALVAQALYLRWIYKSGA